MAGRPREGEAQRTRMLRAFVLLFAAGWLLALTVIASGPGIGTVAAAARVVMLPVPSPSVPPQPSITPSAISTDTPTPNAGATATVASTVTTTPTTSAGTATPSATAVPTSGDQGGGYNPNTGPQPTKVVFAQPTVGVGDNGGLGSLDPSAFGSNGLLLATSMSCVVAILGLIVAGIALYVLVNGGYGPFLRMLVLGKRAKGAGVGAAAADGEWDVSGAYEFDASAEYAARPPSARAAAGGSPGRGRGDDAGYSEARVRPRSGPRLDRDSGERW